MRIIKLNKENAGTLRILEALKILTGKNTSKTYIGDGNN
jgi:hypothetical protein